MHETLKPKSETQSGGAIRSPLIALTRWRDEFEEMLSARVRKSHLSFPKTWYLGPLTLGTFTIQLATGVLLMLYYHPSIPQAYATTVSQWQYCRLARGDYWQRGS